MKPIGDCIFVVYLLMIFASLVRFYVFFMPPGGSKMLAVDVSIGPYQWLGRSPSYHEVLTPVQLLLRLQNHHHHTQAATTTTLQTSLAMDQEEKKQVQPIRDQLKGHSLPDGGEILGSINLSSSEFTATNNRAHIVRQYESGSTASERKTTRETPDRKGITFSLFSLEDLRQYFVRKLINAVSVCILLAIYLFCSKVSLRLRVRSSTQPSASQVEIVERILLSLSDFAATIDNSPYEPIIYPRFFRCDARKQPIPAPPPKALDKPKVSQLLSLSDFAAFIDNNRILNRPHCTVPHETTRKPPVPAPGPAPAPPPKAPEKPKVPKKRKLAKGKERVTLENLQQYFGHKRKDVAASLGVSVSTFKRMCRLQGITRWQNQMGSSGSVSKPLDQLGERNPPSTCKTLSTNVQTEMENEMNEFLLDFDNGPNGTENASKLPTFQDSCRSIFSGSSMYNENEEAGVSYEWPSQLRNQWTVSTAHPNSSVLVVPHPHMASQILSENMGSFEEWGGNLFASLEEPLLPSHDSGSMSTVPPCSYPVPSQPMPTIPHTLGSSEDRRNSLAFLQDVFPEEHVSGSLLAPGEDISLEEHVHTMGSSDDLRNLLASTEEHFSAGHVFGFIDQIVPSCLDPAPRQSMPNALHTMPPLPHMMPLLAERQDTRSVMLKATYGDIAIKFQLPLTCGIGKLKEEVSKRLECEPGSYHVEYKDEDGTWIIINCDEDVRIFLYLFTSLGSQVIKLRVRDKAPNTTKFCQCGHAADH